MARHVALAALPCRPREMVFLLCRLRSANEGTRYQSLSSVLTTSTAAKLVVGREGSRRLEPLLPQGFVWSSPCKFERKNEGTRSSDSDSEVEEQEVRRPLIPCARVKERGRDLPSASVQRTVLLVRGTPAARLLFVAVALPALRRSCTTFDAKFNNGQHDDKRRRCLSGTLLTRGGKGNPSHGTVVAGCRRSSRPTAVCRQPGLVAGDFVPCPRHCHQYLHTGPRYPSKSDFGYLKSIRNYSAPERHASLGQLLTCARRPGPARSPDQGQPPVSSPAYKSYMGTSTALPSQEKRQAHDFPFADTSVSSSDGPHHTAHCSLIQQDGNDQGMLLLPPTRRSTPGGPARHLMV
jgi:hypothetical protein